jgi:hypothetical protein
VYSNLVSLPNVWPVRHHCSSENWSSGEENARRLRFAGEKGKVVERLGGNVLTLRPCDDDLPRCD